MNEDLVLTREALQCISLKIHLETRHLSFLKVTHGCSSLLHVEQDANPVAACPIPHHHLLTRQNSLTYHAHLTFMGIPCETPFQLVPSLTTHLLTRQNSLTYHAHLTFMGIPCETPFQLVPSLTTHFLTKQNSLTYHVNLTFMGIQCETLFQLVASITTHFTFLAKFYANLICIGKPCFSTFQPTFQLALAFPCLVLTWNVMSS